MLILYSPDYKSQKWWLFIGYYLQICEQPINVQILFQIKNHHQMKETVISFERCFACLNFYDTGRFSPMLICSAQHLCCLSCFKSRKNKSHLLFVCPICRESVRRDKVVNYQNFYYFPNKGKQIQNTYKEKCDKQKNQAIRLMQIKLKQKQETIKVLLGKSKNFQEKQMTKYLLDQAKALGKFSKFKEASNILKIIIESNPQNNEGQFIGFGSYQESVGYYQNKIYEWHESKYKQKQISVYDLLAMCNLCQPIDQILIWYEKLKNNHPNNIKILYGLATVLHNGRKFIEAMSIYESLIEVHPSFSKSYQMCSFIYLHEKNYSLAQKLSIQCLQIQPTNIYCKYILAKCKLQQDKLEGRQMLLKVNQQDLQYLRPIYEIGQSLNQDNQIRAFTYWEKCNNINPLYLEPLIAMAKYQFKTIQNSERCIEIINTILQKDYINQPQKLICYAQLGLSYHFIEDWQNAIWFFQKYFNEKRFHQNLEASQCLADSYYFSHNYKKSIKVCKSCLSKTIISQNQSNIPFYVILIKSHYSINSYQTVIQLALLTLKKHTVQLLYFYLANSYFFLEKLDEAQRWINLCIENSYQVESIQILRVQILQKKSLESQAWRLALFCLQNYQLSDLQCDKLKAIIMKVSHSILRSKKQIIKNKKQQKGIILRQRID